MKKAKVVMTKNSWSILAMYNEKDFKPYDKYGSRASLKKTEIALSEIAEIALLKKLRSLTLPRI